MDTHIHSYASNKKKLTLLITKHVRTWLDFLLLWTSKNVINLKRTNRLQSILAPIPHTVASLTMAPPNFWVSSFVSLFGFHVRTVFWRMVIIWKLFDKYGRKAIYKRTIVWKRGIFYGESSMGTPTNWFAISRK